MIKYVNQTYQGICMRTILAFALISFIASLVIFDYTQGLKLTQIRRVLSSTQQITTNCSYINSTLSNCSTNTTFFFQNGSVVSTYQNIQNNFSNMVWSNTSNITYKSTSIVNSSFSCYLIDTYTSSCSVSNSTANTTSTQLSSFCPTTSNSSMNSTICYALTTNCDSTLPIQCATTNTTVNSSSTTNFISCRNQVNYVANTTTCTQYMGSCDSTQVIPCNQNSFALNLTSIYVCQNSITSNKKSQINTTACAVFTSVCSSALNCQSLNTTNTNTVITMNQIGDIPLASINSSNSTNGQNLNFGNIYTVTAHIFTLIVMFYII